MRGKNVLYALNDVNQSWVQEADEFCWERKSHSNIRHFAAAACLCLVLLGALWLGGSPVIPGPDGPGAAVPPVELSQAPTEADPVQTLPPESPRVTINWNFVEVNEAEGLGADAALRYYDPALYDTERWGKEQVTEYYGWDLVPAYLPEKLKGDAGAPAPVVIRDKTTGELVQDQACNGFWVDRYEDGSPKSDDDIVIPTGFTVTASRLGILHCALLPVDEERITRFDRTDVVITHASLPYGPFDPTRRDPSGLYNMPAGYYDIYTATFTLDGVEYEVETQRMELEELIRIVASIVKPNEDIIVGVGC